MSAAPVGRSNGAAFTIVVSVVMFFGACLMAVVLLMSDAPGALVVGVLLAALPVAPVLACFIWLDRYEPEPRSLLLLGLGWGAFVATSSALILQVIGEFAFRDKSFSGVVVAPMTEEAAKGLFILLLLWFRRAELDGVLDGIVYAGMVGVGFAFTENILYLSSAYVGDAGGSGGINGAVGLFVIRGVFSPFAHPLFTTFTGIGIGLAVGSRKPWVRVVAPVVGYLAAVTAHAAWNGSLLLGGDGASFVVTYLLVMVPGFFLIVGFAIWARRREGKVLTMALTDCARRGFLDPGEIPWLVRLPARRAARRAALLAGGKAARETMAQYQQQAVELGFLHSRYLRGTAPKDVAARGQGFVDAMRTLRPQVLWPTPAGGARPPTADVVPGGRQ